MVPCAARMPAGYAFATLQSLPPAYCVRSRRAGLVARNGGCAEPDPLARILVASAGGGDRRAVDRGVGSVIERYVSTRTT